MCRLIMMMLLSFIFIIPQAWAGTSPYPDPNRQTMWNNLTDGIHTMGQTPQQASITKKKLHNARRNARSKSINQAQEAKRRAQMKAWQQSQQ